MHCVRHGMRSIFFLKCRDAKPVEISQEAHVVGLNERPFTNTVYSSELPSGRKAIGKRGYCARFLAMTKAEGSKP